MLDQPALLPPNVYDAEPIPPEAMAEVTRILTTGDLFRYTADASPVARMNRDRAFIPKRNA